MKKMTLIVAALVIASTVFGQSNKEDVDLLQAMYGKEKKELVSGYMVIPESKSAAFWTLYDQYEADRKSYGKKRIALIEEYANAYDNLNDAKAVELMNKKIELYNSFGKLQQKYFDKMVKLIGGKQAAKIYQAKDYLENNLRLSIQDEIPFIDQLDKSKTGH